MVYDLLILRPLLVWLSHPNILSPSSHIRQRYPSVEQTTLPFHADKMGRKRKRADKNGRIIIIIQVYYTYDWLQFGNVSSGQSEESI